MNNEIYNILGSVGMEQVPPVSSEELIENNWVGKSIFPSKEAWESLGFVFLDNPNNKYVYDAKFPEGWSMRRKKYDYILIEIVDEKGRVRGTLLPHIQGPTMGLYNRYDICTVDSEDRTTLEVYFGNKTEKLYVAGQMQLKPVKSKEESQALYEQKCLLEAKAEKFAIENFPDWKNPLLYWDYDKDISQKRA